MSAIPQSLPARAALATLALLATAASAAPVRAQAPEPASRFAAAAPAAALLGGAPLPTRSTTSPLAASVAVPPRLAPPGDSRRGFALILGMVLGGAAGAGIGCLLQCDGPFPVGPTVGGAIGIPLGGVILVWMADRL